MRVAQPMLRHADQYVDRPSYYVASYDKLVVVLRAFAAEYGDVPLLDGLRAYGAAWSGRHPYPEDFYRTVFAAAGDDREVFVREWVRGTGWFDASIDRVTSLNDSLTVAVRLSGGARLSVPVVVTRVDGSTERLTIAAADFRRAAVQRVHVPDPRSVASVELDPERRQPDLDRANQRWTRR